ncbi:MAG: hypothetical protein ACYC21_08105 [Eubacteriales bacterium]
MKRKKLMILITSLALLLGITTAAYAWYVGGTSSIATGYITMTGTSTTNSDVGCSYMFVDNTLYKDDAVAGGSTKEATGVLYSLPTTCTGANTLGNQYWKLYGIHKATYSGTTKSTTSYTEVIW